MLVIIIIVCVAKPQLLCLGKNSVFGEETLSWDAEEISTPPLSQISVVTSEDSVQVLVVPKKEFLRHLPPRVQWRLFAWIQYWFVLNCMLT